MFGEELFLSQTEMNMTANSILSTSILILSWGDLMNVLSEFPEDYVINTKKK